MIHYNDIHFHEEIFLNKFSKVNYKMSGGAANLRVGGANLKGVEKISGGVRTPSKSATGPVKKSRGLAAGSRS